ncbi:MAG: hypothetical protein LBF83_11975 [Spirochaetaceae bacterium]|jgi:hypothetical protein|nr:hypothetical protein [Spirochaetaceae bacterium]
MTNKKFWFRMLVMMLAFGMAVSGCDDDTDEGDDEQERLCVENKYQGDNMGKSNHNADIQNANKKMPGTNKTYDQNQGNRGKQLNPVPNDANQKNGVKKK